MTQPLVKHATTRKFAVLVTAKVAHAIASEVLKMASEVLRKQVVVPGTDLLVLIDISLHKRQLS